MKNNCCFNSNCQKDRQRGQSACRSFDSSKQEAQIVAEELGKHIATAQRVVADNDERPECKEDAFGAIKVAMFFLCWICNAVPAGTGVYCTESTLFACQIQEVEFTTVILQLNQARRKERSLSLDHVHKRLTEKKCGRPR